MDTAYAIEKLVGLGVKYGGITIKNTKEEFNNLRWNDKRPRPKWAELVIKWEETKDIPEPKSELELLQEEMLELKTQIIELEKLNEKKIN